MQLCAQCTVSLRASAAGVLTDLPQSGRQGGPEPASGPGRQVAGYARAVGALVLDGQLHAEVPAPVAVVGYRHGPGDARLLLVVGGVVVEREIDRLLHGRSQPGALACGEGDDSGDPG